MFNTKKWKKFYLNQLFSCVLSKGDLKEEECLSGEVPLVSSGSTNNGIVKYIDSQGDGKAQIFEGNCLTIDMFCNCFYQEKKFYAVSHGRVNILLPKFSLNKNIGLFLATVINVQRYKFSYGRAVYSSVAEKIDIKLPVDSYGNPDWEYMDNFIHILENKKGNNSEPIKDALKTNKLSVKNKITSEFWKKFKISDIFTIYTGKDLIYSTLIPGQYDVVGHGKENLGLVGTTEKLDGYPLFDNNKTISLADRGNFFATARPAPFYVGTRVKALTYKFGDIDIYSLMFIANIINKEEYRFTYGRNSTNKLPNLEIKSPVKEDGTPDCLFMSNYIKALPFSDRI